MPTLIDKPQLQATAQVAKSFILDQAISTADSLISAMSLSGGSSSGGSAKTIPTLTISATYPDIQLTAGSNGHYSAVYDLSLGDVTFTINYNGDANVFACCSDGVYGEDGAVVFALSANQNQFEVDAMTMSNAWYIFIFAEESNNFASKAIVLELPQ